MILTAFPGPRWLIQLANMCIVLHVATAWQVGALLRWEAALWRQACACSPLGLEEELEVPSATSRLLP